ncbi:MAG: phosphohydrolase [Treponema sp.]|nr:phosphohydrolase [Treponema sp.]
MALTNEIIELTSEKDPLPLLVAKELIEDEEIEAVQNYANNVSIVRLGYNDHGPVHMRTVCRNALKMLKILHQAGIKTSLETEQAGTFSDSVTAVILSGFFHDFGMTIGRQDHELYSGILGHMGTRRIHSIEAGLILIADGCDMTKGRARIPMELNTKPSVGDIHKYSANSIESVKIHQGNEKPIQIEVFMSSDVGFFQIEEVLIPKINSSPAKGFIELYAGVKDKEMKKYL